MKHKLIDFGVEFTKNLQLVQCAKFKVAATTLNSEL